MTKWSLNRGGFWIQVLSDKNTGSWRDLVCSFLFPLPPVQAYPKALTDEVRESLKQNGSRPQQDLFRKIRAYLLIELSKQYWIDFIVR